MAMENKKEQIDKTKNILDRVNKDVTPQKEQEIVFQGKKDTEVEVNIKATLVAENIVNDLVREVSNKIKEPKSIHFDCEECEGVFIIKEKLVEHVQRIHKEKVQELSFQCEKCSGKFTDKDKLNEHILMIHADTDQNLLCKYCKLKLLSTHELENMSKNTIKTQELKVKLIV